MCLIIFSHSDYAYLWPIIEEKIALLSNINTIFFSNFVTSPNAEKPIGFKNYVEYNDKLSYSERWIHLLEDDSLNNILNDYLIIVHDVHIILNCDVDKLNRLIETLRENKIDRCSMNVFNGSEFIQGEIPICDLNSPNVTSNTMIPYDVGPAIWNKKSFLKLWNTFPNMSYRESELNNNLQNYCKDNFKCYGLQKNNNHIYYCLGRPYYDFFNILIITIKGEITFPTEVYMDSQFEFKRLFNKYNLFEKIKINTNYKCIIDNFNPI